MRALAKFRSKHGRYEAYNKGRYFCITGHTNGLPINHADKPFAEFAKSCLGERADKPSKPSNPPNSSPIESKPHEAMSEAELRYRLLMAKQDAKFAIGYNGGWEEDKHSETVQSFLCKVAFYFGEDFDTADNLFRQSSLWAGKWSEGKWDRLGESEWDTAVAFEQERFTLPDGWQMRLSSAEGLPIKTTITEIEPGLPSVEKKPTRRRGYRLTDFASMPTPKWLVKEHLPCQSLGIVYGVSGSCKTFYSVDMGLSVASGLPFLGVYPVVQAGVLYLTGEGNASIQHRIKAWLRAHGLKEPEYPNDCVFVPFQFDLLSAGELQPIEEIIKHDLCKQPGLIIVDTLARYFGIGDENKTQDMNRFIRNLDKLKEKTGATICVVHHAGWDDSRERGASALRGAADTIVGISKENNILVKCVKQKDAEPFSEYLLKPQSHDVGVNEDGDDITSLTLALTDEQEKKYLLLPRAKKDALINLWLKHNANPFTLEQAKDTLEKSKAQSGKDLQELHRRFAMLNVTTKEDRSNVYLIKPELYNALKKECLKLFPSSLSK